MKVKVTIVVAIVLASSVALSARQNFSSSPAGVVPGPSQGKLGDLATVSVPEGYVFLDASATKRFLQETQNIPSGRELGTVLFERNADSHWFAVFSYSDVGHVDDGDRNSIDADTLMKDMRDSSKQDNAERKKRGWPELTLAGWQKKPYYDTGTNNLTWSMRVLSAAEMSVNHSVRLLGRTGVMAVQLVADGSDDQAITEFNTMLKGFTYVAGQRYAEFKKGDKLAGYGLAALIGAGAAGVALKTGLLQKLWKVIVFGVVAVVGIVRKLFSGGSGKKTPAGQTSATGTR